MRHWEKMIRMDLLCLKQHAQDKSRLAVQDVVPMYFSFSGEEKKRKSSRIIPQKKGNVRFLIVGLCDWT